MTRKPLTWKLLSVSMLQAYQRILSGKLAMLEVFLQQHLLLIANTSCRFHWFKQMCNATSSSHVPYTGPAYNAMRTTLLDAVKRRVDDSLAPWLEHALRYTGFVLVSDGWTDAQNRPLIQLLAMFTQRAEISTCS